MSTKRSWGLGAAILSCLLMTSCEWKLPITVDGTRDVVDALVGDWFSTKDGEPLKIRKWDSRHYVLATGSCGTDLYSAHHSDLDKWQLMSIRNLKSDEADGWTWVQWKLIDADHLEVKVVNEKVIPQSVIDRAEVVKMLKANRENPELFGDPLVYARAGD